MLNYLKLAAEVADLHADTHRKAFVGAVAVRRDGVIVSSRNGSVPNPSHRYPLAHAEVRLLRKAGQRAIIYISRVRRDGSLGMAKPCHTCMHYLRSRRVDSVYYTISNSEWGGFAL